MTGYNKFTVNVIIWQNICFHISVIIRPDIYRLNISIKLKSIKNFINEIKISNIILLLNDHIISFI